MLPVVYGVIAGVVTYFALHVVARLTPDDEDTDPPT